MRILALLLAFVVPGCAASTSSSDGAEGARTATSIAFVATNGGGTSPVIRVEAGTVRVNHTVPAVGRLRATILEGLDEPNRHVRYEWDRDGTYPVAVSGRYRHSVTGGIVGGGPARIRSVLTYTEAADTAGT